jgi:hypothetical protein
MNRTIVKLIEDLTALKQVADVNGIPEASEFWVCVNKNEDAWRQRNDLTPTEKARQMFRTKLYQLIEQMGQDEISGTGLTVSDAACITGMTPVLISKACNEGKLKSIGTRRKRRIDPASLMEWAKVQRRGGGRVDRGESDVEVERMMRAAEEDG